MDKVIPFPCPKCGKELVKARPKIRSSDELDAACTDCGYKLTEIDRREHMRKLGKIAVAEIRERIRKGR